MTTRKRPATKRTKPKAITAWAIEGSEGKLYPLLYWTRDTADTTRRALFHEVVRKVRIEVVE